MNKFRFERECRTPHSECYTVLEEGIVVGRLDVHFTASVVHATLNVAESLTTGSIQELIDVVDAELVDTVETTGQEFIVHVHQGRDLGVFSARDFEGNGGYQNVG